MNEKSEEKVGALMKALDAVSPKVLYSPAEAAAVAARHLATHEISRIVAVGLRQGGFEVDITGLTDGELARRLLEIAEREG